MNKHKRLTLISLLSASTIILGACGAANETSDGSGALSGTLNGAGASSQESAIVSWTQGIQEANSDLTVNYDPIGSGGGREQFIAGGVSFAGTDSILDDDEIIAAQERCSSEVIEVPTYISPIAVIFNVDGITELNLGPEVIGGIFSGQITKWNDPKIVADNPNATLPDLAITPVHRADESGTTKNFTDYLDAASNGAWGAGVVETWPFQSGEAAEGTSGVVAAVTVANGTIGYADASQAGELGIAKIKVGNEFVAFSPEAAAKAVDVSPEVTGRPASSLVFELDRTTTESGVYPLVLVSYMVACQSYDDPNEAELVKAWLQYVTSTDGQNAAAAGAGSAPLTADLSARIAPIVDTISAK